MHSGLHVSHIACISTSEPVMNRITDLPVQSLCLDIIASQLLHQHTVIRTRCNMPWIHPQCCLVQQFCPSEVSFMRLHQSNTDEQLFLNLFLHLSFQRSSSSVVAEHCSISCFRSHQRLCTACVPFKPAYQCRIHFQRARIALSPRDPLLCALPKDKYLIFNLLPYSSHPFVSKHPTALCT